MKFSKQYPLQPFKETKFDKLSIVIEQYPLATVVSQSDHYPVVSQIPLILDRENKKLFGHLDKNNPHCEVLNHQQAIYCLFNGPNHYISPDIYPDEQFPGWNYVSVHISGSVKKVDDPSDLTEILLRTAQQNEPPESSYQLQETQQNFDLFSTMITGFEIEIKQAWGIFKLAQDKQAENTARAADHLNQMACRDISGFLKELLD